MRRGCTLGSITIPYRTLPLNGCVHHPASTLVTRSKTARPFFSSSTGEGVCVDWTRGLLGTSLSLGVNRSRQGIDFAAHRLQLRRRRLFFRSGRDARFGRRLFGCSRQAKRRSTRSNTALSRSHPTTTSTIRTNVFSQSSSNHPRKRVVTHLQSPSAKRTPWRTAAAGAPPAGSASRSGARTHMARRRPRCRGAGRGSAQRTDSRGEGMAANTRTRR